MTLDFSIIGKWKGTLEIQAFTPLSNISRMALAKIATDVFVSYVEILTSKKQEIGA